jgi:hypothetical protein
MYIHLNNLCVYNRKMTSPAQRLANKRYRVRNSERCKAINAKSNLKRYHSDDPYRLLQNIYRKEHYKNNRNYRDISNMAVSFKLLFKE